MDNNRRIKLFTFFNDIVFSSELMFLYGLLNADPNDDQHNYNFQGKSRYYGLKKICDEYISYVKNIDDCDVIILPYKFKGIYEPIFEKYNKLSLDYNKPLWCFYNDDKSNIFNIPSNVYLFRTSLYRKTKLPNENPLIAFSPDYFQGKFIENTCSIGYCGQTYHGRKNYLQTLLRSSLKCDFILRKRFWAEISVDKKQIARKEYFENMENNLFIFCHRGEGNFSYRFYETFMMGRIPIFVNTDCVLPFWDKWKHLNVGIFIDEQDVLGNENDWISKIQLYYDTNKNKLIDIQKQNRKLWETYFSPSGFVLETISSFYNSDN